MKNQKPARHYGVVTLIGATALLLHSVVPSPKAQTGASCHAAWVTIGQPVVVSGCASCTTVECFAGAAICDVVCGDWCSDLPTVDTGGTDCQFDIEECGIAYGGSACPAYKITLHDFKRSGTITIGISVTGQYCIGYTNGLPICTNATYSTQGSQVVVVDDRDSCCAGGPGCTGTFLADGNVGNNNALSFHLNLGAVTSWQNGGPLILESATPTANLADPSLLQLPFVATNVTVVRDGGNISQINTPQGLLNVHVLDAYHYQIEAFYPTNVVGPDGSGHYTTNAPAFVTWKVENPDSSSAYNRLWITEQRGSDQRQFQYTYTSSTLQWDLLKPDGQTLSAWPVRVDGSVTNYYRQVVKGGQTIRQNVKTYQYLSSVKTLLLNQEIEGISPASRTTSYTYYPSGFANAAAANKIRRVDYPEGDWRYYVYDTQGRKIKEYAAYCNNPAPADVTTEPDPLTDHCKLTAHLYTLTNTDDEINDPGDPNNHSAVRKTVVVLPVYSGGAWNTQEVSRVYHLSTSPTVSALGGYAQQMPTREETRVCVNPGAKWDDSSNLITVSETYGLTGDFRQSKPHYILNPDKTITAYSYSESPGISATTVEQTGDFGSSFDPDTLYAGVWPDGWLEDGTQTTTIVDGLGKIGSRVAIDKLSSVTLINETYAYGDSGTLFDPSGRSYVMSDLISGRTFRYQLDCCNISYMIDPDGAQTIYYNDILKRRAATKILHGGTSGVTTTNMLDALGRVLVTSRIGTDGTTTATVDQRQYDILGNLIRQTNALGGVTLLTNVIINNQLWTTNIYPDGGVRIECYYRDGRLQSVSGTAVSPITYQYTIEQDGTGGLWRESTVETKLTASGGTAEWMKTYTDGAGQAYKTIYASDGSTQYPTALSLYNSGGQLWKQMDPDGVTTLYAYNGKGEREYALTAVASATAALNSYADLVTDLTGPGSSSFLAGPDRITRIQRTVVAAIGGAPDLIQTDKSVWKDGFSTDTIVETTKESTGGRTNWHTAYRDSSTPVTTTTIIVPGTSRTVTATTPDNAYVVSAYSYGQLSSVTSYDGSSGHTQIARTDYGYDLFGRQCTVTDYRNGPTTSVYNNADLVTSVTTPPPASSGSLSQTNLTFYNKMLQATNVVYPDSTGMTNFFNLTGRLKLACGSRTYPVGYGYDAQGRMTSMTNWSGFAPSSPTGARVTTWNYDQYRGWLKSKDYPDPSTGNPPVTPGTTGPTYAYTSGGRLNTRTWARTGTGSHKIVTTYTYGFDDGVSDNEHGDLVQVSYSYDPQGTPSVSYTYDRLGRQSAVITGGSAVTSLTYNDANELLVETNQNGILDGASVTNGYDTLLRRSVLGAQVFTTPLLQHSFSYDYASRLATAADNSASTTYSATYTYLANSPLVHEITFQKGATTVMTTTKQYDYLNRLKSISSVTAQPSTINSFTYGYNAANQRTAVTNADNSFWVYGYDSLGQVTSGKRFWADGTPVAGQQFEYGFDSIGNRKSTKAGGDTSGNNLRQANYTANSLNQYSSRDVPGYVQLSGTASASAELVAIGDGQVHAAPYRQGDYFFAELPYDNSAGPVWVNTTVAALIPGGGSTPDTASTSGGHVFLAPSPESFSYDADGNLTQDGRWQYTWDAENRLVTAQSYVLGGIGGPIPWFQRVDFSYDARGRRIQKVVSSAQWSFIYYWQYQWVPVSTNRFLYDGWNLIAEVGPPNPPSVPTLLRSYLWGTDLSGSPQGAGGVGGLLQVVYRGAQTTNAFVTFDGNGDVAALVNAADRAPVARYEYSPFGQLLRATGPMAKVNLVRLSSKYQDSESDFIYYGYRYYNQNTGAWSTRDPAEDFGGPSLYTVVNNDPVNKIDFLGLRWRWVGDTSGAEFDFDWKIPGWIENYASGHGHLETSAGYVVQIAGASGNADIYGHYGHFFPTSFHAEDEHMINFRCDPANGEITIKEGSHISQNPPEASADVEITDVTMLDPHTVTGVVKARVALKFSPGSSWSISYGGASIGPSIAIGAEDATLTTRFVFKCRCVN